MTLDIQCDWTRSSDAPADPESAAPVADTAEDRATLGEIAIVAADTLLTEAADSRTAKLRRGANLSAYQLGEWLAWHWWRLRWEARRPPAVGQRDELAWSSAHRLGDIGSGWLWPNVVFESDGTRMVLQSQPSPETPTEPLRFLGGRIVVIPAKAWESGVDAFFRGVLGRLADDGLEQTALRAMWEELQRERDDAELTAYRKIEARLGCNVDEADAKTVESVYEAGRSLGHAAMMEVVADEAATVRQIEDSAKKAGFASPAADRPSAIRNVAYGDDGKAPWRVGVDAARLLRERERLGDGPMTNAQLAKLCALPQQAFKKRPQHLPMAFSLRRGDADQVVLRSNWQTGRRFEAARLLGDALVVGDDEPLRPATTAFTYRQKMQRAFAAEFLCPIESLVNSLDDLSDESQQRAAGRFNVSPWTVAALLVNNDFLDRQEIRELDVAA